MIAYPLYYTIVAIIRSEGVDIIINRDQSIMIISASELHVGLHACIDIHISACSCIMDRMQ